MDFLLTPYLVAGICAALVVACSFKLLRRPNLDHIPVVGHSSLLASYWFTKGLEVDHTDRFVQEGYDKYKSGAFRVASLTHWVVYLHRSHLQDVAMTPEDHLSFNHAADNAFRTEYTFGLNINDDYHLPLIRLTLSRNLPVLYADLRDEIVAACNEYLDLKHNEWKTISAVQATLKIASRASNRILVGLPLCRDSDWLDMNINLPRAVVDEARFLRLFPSFMVPLVAKFVTNLSERTRLGFAFLGPVIKERLQHMEAEGTDWDNKPNDFLQWCMDSKEETSLTSLTRRIIAINFAGIHTTSNTFSEALLNLAENPQYAQALREEVEAVVSNYGWTKEALSKMRKVDSFLKETQRFEGLSVLGLSRKAMSDITLADGTFIPQGTFLAFPAHAMHHDDAVYENPNVFKPFRFADMRNKEFEGSRHQMVAITPDLLSFGLGRHTCPGRFFAATVLKTMLAHIVMSYDVKRGNDESRPNTLHVGRAIVPNPTAKVMFRRREE
ncbi:cytochrome P450 [Pisolithus orientalis]|uniref:cytochrome P450 n=1 Tax=Pisolithus orientalis TaxID=936130 RepID=UPI0022256C06|nr:cytochrome P450 [Pisolithus orientalis]KAI6028873.1 cytochrome P450 [Pisolithus orientalis]